MDELAVEKQIEQMTKFIKQEAQEKANEIKVLAEEEFQLEKLQTLEAEKAKIRKEYERKEGQVEITRKIEYSKQLNEQRLKILAARQQAITTVLLDAKTEVLKTVGNKSEYKKLLQLLLAQAMTKMHDPNLLVKCREADLSLVKECIETARSSYKVAVGSEAPQLVLVEKDFLPPPPTNAGDEDELSCLGGVMVTSSDGRIVCNNTLDARLDIAYQQNLPSVRAILFGKEAAVH